MAPDHRAPASAIVDATFRIMLFRKLKLTSCAPIPGLPAIGFFVRAQCGGFGSRCRGAKDARGEPNPVATAGAACSFSCCLQENRRGAHARAGSGRLAPP